MPEKKPPPKSAKPAPGRKAAPKPSPRRRRPADAEMDAVDLPDLDEDGEQAESARPVAVAPGAQPEAPAVRDAEEPTVPDAGAGLPTPGAGFGEHEVSPFGAGPESPVERPLIEAVTGLAALLLALSALIVDWYRSGTFPAGGITGWQSGDLGPVIFFLAVAVVAIVVLRRMRVRLQFPVEPSWVLELTGWLIVALLLLKRFFLTPANAGVNQGGWAVSLVLAVALAFAAGYTSSSAPFVVKPGWFGPTAGKLGIGIFTGALVLGIVFGMISSPPGPEVEKPPKVEQGMPKCAQGFPSIAGVTALNGFERDAGPAGKICTASLRGSISVASVIARYKTALTKAGIKFQQQGAGSPAGQFLTLQGPRCGFISASRTPGAKTTSVAFTLTVCPKS